MPAFAGIDDIIGRQEDHISAARHDRKPVLITYRSFKAAAQHAPYIETKPLHSSQMVVEREEDGSVILQINVCLNNELERALLGYGDGVEVLSPPALRRKMVMILKNATNKYE